VEFEFG
jgi:hypothetical protein